MFDPVSPKFPGTLTYACVGGPPDDWNNIEIIDLGTGKPVSAVIECNTAEGWLERYVTAPDNALIENPATGFPLRERIEGNFRLQRRKA